MNNIDWQYLRRAIIILLLTSVIAVTMSIAGDRYQAAQLKKYESSVSTLRATHRRYRNLVSDIDILEQYRALYNDYKSTGLVGEERRLSWIESLETTNKVIRLPRLTYKLNPQGEFERPGLPAKQGVILKSAAMGI